jgi:hypothetical protein
MSKLDNDEAMVYKDFFITSLLMPPHAALVDILLHFQAQMHQLTPNAIAQLSKYFWAVGSFGGVLLQNDMSCTISRRLYRPPRGIKSHNMDI